MTNILNKPKYFFALLNAKKRITIEQGGTSSGKTCTTLDVLFYIGIQEPNSVITVVGQDVPNLKMRKYRDWETDRKSTRLNSSHRSLSRMPSSA